MYVFKSLYGIAPVYLQDLLTVYKPTRSLRSENSMRIQTPRVKTKLYGVRRFDMAASTLWNNLPGELRVLDSVDIFKSKLKTHLFGLAFYELFISFWFYRCFSDILAYSIFFQIPSFCNVILKAHFHILISTA